MVDKSRSGARCSTVRYIQTVNGNLPRGSKGTVVYEVDSLGRRLIFVKWDIGISVAVFPDEIDIEAEKEGETYARD